MNMMRKNNNNRGGGNKHRGGGRRYNNNGGGGNRGGQNDGQNLQRQKHHATQQLGKYNDMARNAQINGDRVDVEYYLQHVDHYTRVLADIAAIEAERYAHQREHAPHVQAEGSQSQEGGEVAADAEAAGSSESTGSEGGSDYTPRPHHRNRQRYQQQTHQEAPQADGNGAREANSNTTEIPLPGNILPPI